MIEWKKVKFLDVVSLNPLVSLEKGVKYPFVEMSNAVPGARKPDNDVCKVYTGGGAKFEKGDTVVARIEPCLQNGKGFQCSYEKGFGSTEFLVFRPLNTKVIDYNYLYYFMGQQSIRETMAKTMVGASGRQRVNNAVFKDLSINLPKLSIQHRIATILSRYDSLIENYQKQIKLLEEAAQRLYKEWFVDLQFPGHETTKIVDGVPEGWEKKTFGSVIEYEIGGGWGADIKTSNETISAYVIRGTDMSALDNGIWNNLPYRFHQESNFRARQLEHNDIIFEVSGGSKNEGVAKTFLVQQELLDHLDNHVICASFCKLIRLKDKSTSYFVYDTLKEWRVSGITSQYDKRSASSIVNYRWKDFLVQQAIIIPNKYILRGYTKRSELIHSRITKISSQIRLLTEARDRLLPKLMSGEIAV